MKPRDLQFPFLWKERCPKIQDCVLYVPEYYFEHKHFLMPSWHDFFGNSHPMICELCSGNGDWVISQALSSPQTNWIAVEKRFDRVRKIWSKMKNFQVNNLRIVHGTAQTFLHYYVGDASLQRIVVNFPDPWPKMRHRKHRLFQTEFLQDVFRVLQNQGSLALATDSKTYLIEAINMMQRHFTSLIQEPYYQSVNDYGGSWFEKLWRSKGREIFYTEFVKDLGYS
ncbi:tRNA (guanosine(46)-N7)-methyltransferase TrmB [Chlamydia gallinacea]|uniref:tRNA (guanine-N(7)-)-methyltransferase n=2 Tax=Chlamydia gallinacea TaxID=1457153 RepID=A0A173DY51_9CHLA|nr:tRNA (guanosine(46)-N7)-methyltransferase TrmB [Chlamydia gallinacea]ANG65854.1 tRNA (guanosine(46)-N7)-methyltransferase TrmB [Chlamydia gallinacea 08-1274/3]AQT77090.1 tRNA (guanosine(46)-N7)-methyltransferase TrmB [Chlamydia gallinacea]MBX6680410.1 tRNA (guanosine(46)-N7)-methyltransferase TrmB [Chlamydia gallinacea]MBX6687468.1 tRNA (guanosine(46)-N7)-methyltransferase TrmB [Chlamydia gallinacea]